MESYKQYNTKTNGQNNRLYIIYSKVEHEMVTGFCKILYKHRKFICCSDTTVQHSLTKCHNEYMPERLKESRLLTPTDEFEIYDILNKAKAKKSAGHMIT